MILFALLLPLSASTSGQSWPACSDMSALTARSMLGDLSVDERTCLDQRTLADTREPDRVKAIELLLTDAWSRGDQGAWMHLRVRWLKTSTVTLDVVPNTVETLHGQVSPADMLAFIDRSLAAHPGTSPSHIPVLHARFDLLVSISERSAPTERLSWRARARQTARGWAKTARAVPNAQQEELAVRACVDVGGRQDWCSS